MTHKVVVVLGSGRSGTSLVMQILHGLGMSVSQNLTEASAANPAGPFEDFDIFQFQTSLITALGGSAAIPLPEDWIRDRETFRAIDFLSEVMQNRLNTSKGLFGFKDPKTSMLIPMWIRIFNKLKISPIYVLAHRNIGSTVSSYLRQYNQPAHLAELTCLIRLMDSLEYTAADCFVAHYEDWFVEPLPLVSDLLAFVGLNPNPCLDAPSLVGQIIRPNLDRSSRDSYEIKNPCLIKLDAALKFCRGAKFDRVTLMNVVSECREEINGFKGWHQMARDSNRKLAESKVRLEKANADIAKLKSLEARVRELEREKLQSEQLAQQVLKLQWQLDHFSSLA